MGARSFDDAYGMYLHDVRARWAGVFWASWAALMRNRAVCVGHASAEMLRTPAAAISRGAVEAPTPACGRARCTSAAGAGVGEQWGAAAIAWGDADANSG